MLSGIDWSNTSKTPKLFVFHLSIVIPALTFWLHDYGLLVLLLWAVADLGLQYYKLTARALITRVRLWFRGGFRTSYSRRHFRKIRQGTNR